MQAVRMKSDLIKQALQRYIDTTTLRVPPVRRTIVIIGTLAVARETDNKYKDRIDRHNAKVYKSRTLILDNYDGQIAKQCVEAYSTAQALQTYLESQFGKQGMLQEYSIYLEQVQLQYNSRDLEKFCEIYRGKLLKVNQILDFKISDKYGLFVFLLLISEYFPQFIANIRQEIRNTETVGTASSLTLTKCITNLLDENTTQTNEGSLLAALIAIRKTTALNPR